MIIFYDINSSEVVGVSAVVRPASTSKVLHFESSSTLNMAQETEEEEEEVEEEEGAEDTEDKEMVNNDYETA